MNDERRRGEGLAVATIVAAAVLAMGLVCAAVFAVGLRFYASKNAAQARAAEMRSRLEALEAAGAARAAEMSSKAIESKATESKDDSAITTTPDG